MPSSTSSPDLLPLLYITLVCIALLYSTLLLIFLFFFFFFLFFSSYLIKQRYTFTGHSSTPRRASLPGEGFIKNGGKGCPYHTLGQCLSLSIYLFTSFSLPLSLPLSFSISHFPLFPFSLLLSLIKSLSLSVSCRVTYSLSHTCLLTSPRHPLSSSAFYRDLSLISLLCFTLYF